ncbi:hypothetical protein SELMODRAFT_412647 [Selaginella moellendorffii]|uniref:Pentatricopeptide repeat-containing protein n=1 Tax=Selaginella moellendorffii TaxID=88036 RepID=D8RM61_SELML|nr:hypothetical protein SELMODRAFT_412647 [Selaginella moellendorffii]
MRLCLKWHFDTANHLFERMPGRSAVTYTDLLLCGTNGKLVESKRLFDEMASVSWNSMLMMNAWLPGHHHGVSPASHAPSTPKFWAAFHFEKKHAYQLLVNCLKHIDKGYDKRKPLWSSFEKQQLYSVDVQVPGNRCCTCDCHSQIMMATLAI